MTEVAGLLAADLDARHRALDPGRSFIVQAPAGSGKTELLIQRYLRLLATVDEPEEVLAITFTRKAAAEMRLRVVAALEAAAEGQVFDSPHRRLTIELAAAVIDRDAARDWGLPENPGRLRILTIDALNASIARMLPVSSGAGAGGSIVDDSEMQRLYRQAAAATLDWLATGERNADVVRDVLLHLDADTAVYVGQLAYMLARRDQWLPFIRSGAIEPDEAARLRSAFERHLQALIGDALATVHRGFPASAGAALPALAGYAAANLCAAGNAAHPVARLADLARLPPPALDNLDDWLAIAEFLLTGTRGLRRQVDKRLGFPPGDAGEKAAMQVLLANVAECPGLTAALAALRELPPPRYSDEQWTVLLDLFRLLPMAAAELRILCQQRGITDHVEVAISAAAALGTPDEPGNVALLLDYSLRHILVDEMQDTSRAQYRLLESLTAGWEPGDGRSLFCVGDPMQSIYRFRNAEVMQFLRARDRGLGDLRLEPLVLRQNFRSGEHLVEWFNRTFPQVLAGADEPLSGAIRYTPSVPAPAGAGLGRVVVHPVIGSSVESEAEEGAAVVAGLVRAHPGESVAVLVRGRTQLPALLRRLRGRGIAYQAIDIDRLTDLPEVIELLALTRALVHPGDRLAWLALLRAPWAGLDWTDLRALVADAPAATVPELLADDARLATLSVPGRRAVAAVTPVLREAMQPGRATSLRARVERCWYALGGPALLADDNAVNNAYHYLHTLAGLETAGTLAELGELYAQLDAERVSSTTQAAVQVMTLHKAKGLQFDHVVLFGTGRRSAANRAAILSWLDLPGDGAVDEKLLSPIGRRDELERDPLQRFIARTDASKDAHETGRLLYVGCTRAQQSLHIVGHAVPATDGDDLREPAAGTLLRYLWPVVADDFAAAAREPQAAPGVGDDPVYVAPPLHRVGQPWQPSIPEPPVSPAPAPAEGAAEARVEFDWVGFDARLAGTVVHRWLHRFATGSAAARASLPESFAATSRRWLGELGAPARLQDGILDRVRAALLAVLRDPQGRWILDGGGAAELALTGLHDGRVQSIVIDRVRVDDEGTHWVIDYKTSAHEGGNLEGFLAAEAERYRPQLRKYAGLYAAYAGVPARCGLYFPLLARFVAVEID